MNSLQHPEITALERDGYPDGEFLCHHCGDTAKYFDSDKQLCEDCAEQMITHLGTQRVMELMGWEVSS